MLSRGGVGVEAQERWGRASVPYQGVWTLFVDGLLEDLRRGGLLSSCRTAKGRVWSPHPVGLGAPSSGSVENAAGEGSEREPPG